MAIGAISSQSVATQYQVTAKTPESAEPRNVPDRDGDADDRGTSATSTQAAATVNTSGQVVGSLLNVKA